MGRTLCFPAVLVILVLTVGTELASGENLPESLARFVYELNGDYTAEVLSSDAQGKPLVTSMNKSYIPMDVPGFENPMILIREYYTGGENIILEVYQDNNGLIHEKTYSISEADADESMKHSPVKLPDGATIQLTSGCDGLFSEITLGFFQGVWKDCTVVDQKQNPVYTFQVTCESSNLIINNGEDSDVFNFKRLSSTGYAWVPRILEKMQATKDPCDRA